MRCAAQRVDGGVVRDAKQPARQPPRRIERGEVPERLDEGLLRQIFREHAVPRHARNQADDRALIATDNLLEC